MTVFEKKIPVINFVTTFFMIILVWIRIRIGSVFSNRLDPDSVNTDSKQWYLHKGSARFIL
jgi:hypothetical protein